MEYRHARSGHEPLSEQRLAIGGGNTRAPARRPGRRTRLERGLDGVGDESRGLLVDDDVPAEQDAADDLPGIRGRVMRADGGGLGHTRTVEETSVRRVLSSGAGEFLVPMGMSCEVGFLLRLVFGVPRFRGGPPRGPGCGHAEVPRRDD